jgi:predicted TIM-barrel fold metal-dependent hydrolase
VAPGPAPVGPVDVDIHCHAFSAIDLPIVGFVAHHIPGLSDFTREVVRWPELVVRTILSAVAALPNAVAPTGSDELAGLERALKAPPAAAPIPPVAPLPSGLLDDLTDRLAGLLPSSLSLGPDTRKMISRYVDTLYVVSQPRSRMSATLATTYRPVTVFTPSLVDYDAWAEDASPTPLATQIQIHAAISGLSIKGKVGRPDARFHPFVAFDPRRDAEAKAPATPALEMVRHAVELGFVGVKVYPPVGFAPLDNARLRPRQSLSPRLDAALEALYAYCEAEELPITTHASTENEFTLGARELVAPERWRPVLARHPALRLNFGHYGHDYGIRPPDGVRSPDSWMHQASALMQAYPNVYADLSGSVWDPGYAARFAGYLGDIIAAFPRVKKRLMYGSDWWPSRLDPGGDDALGATRKVLAGVLSPDELVDVMGRNALRFLGFLDEDNRPRGGRAARRLRHLYGGSPAPAWLA